MLKIMKTKNNTIPSFIIALATILIFSSCSKTDNSDGAAAGPCPTPDTSFCYIYSSDLAKIPYHVRDTIKLQSDSAGTIYSFISQTVDTGYSLFQEPPQGCPGNFQKWQSITRKFISSVYQYPLIESQYQTDCNGCAVNIYFDQNIFSTDCSALRPPFDYPQITINGKTYQNVRIFTKKYDTTQYALFNSTEGVLEIVSGSKIWKRIP